MLTPDFINNQLNSGLPVNFATTDQTIQAAQQNQQQLLAQTTVVDEAFVIQHIPDDPQEIYNEPEQVLEHIEIQVPTIVANRVSVIFLHTKTIC